MDWFTNIFGPQRVKQPAFHNPQTFDLVLQQVKILIHQQKYLNMPHGSLTINNKDLPLGASLRSTFKNFKVNI